MNEPVTAAPQTPSDWGIESIPHSRRDTVLDVAAGTGRAGRALAGGVREVIALDADATALERGREEASAAGIENILFIRGDAAALPFLDASFRVVLCRFALHRFADPLGPLREIKRVLAPHGWLGLADLVVSEYAAVAERQNRIERLRDPAFIHAWSASELQDRLVRLGFEVAGAETREARRSLEGWLEQTRTPAGAAEEIRTLVQAELDGGATTGLTPRVESDANLSIGHTHTSLLVLNRDA